MLISQVTSDSTTDIKVLYARDAQDWLKAGYIKLDAAYSIQETEDRILERKHINQTSTNFGPHQPPMPGSTRRRSTDKDRRLNQTTRASISKAEEARKNHTGTERVADQGHRAFPLGLVDQSICENLAGF